MTFEKSWLLRRRAIFFSVSWFTIFYTDNFTLERLRRLARMCRPFFVDIRARNPCFRLRGILFGCQVLFGIKSLRSAGVSKFYLNALRILKVSEYRSVQHVKQSRL